MNLPFQPGETVPAPWQDDHILVQECLKDNADAWSALIDKYKNLIFSIPIKYGFSVDDATEIFQAVCLTLLSELPKLREPQALAAWLIQITSHKCFRWKDQQQRSHKTEIKLQEEGLPVSAPPLPEELFREIEREQLLREAIFELPSDCRRLVEILFFTNPPISYEDAAKILGIAKGSIGATRMRCLERLRRSLERKGF